MKKNEILTSGAAGFIVSRLVKHFLNKKYSIIAFDRYKSNNDY